MNDAGHGGTVILVSAEIHAILDRRVELVHHSGTNADMCKNGR